MGKKGRFKIVLGRPIFSRWLERIKKCFWDINWCLIVFSASPGEESRLPHSKAVSERKRIECFFTLQTIGLKKRLSALDELSENNFRWISIGDFVRNRERTKYLLQRSFLPYLGYAAFHVNANGPWLRNNDWWARRNCFDLEPAFYVYC